MRITGKVWSEMTYEPPREIAEEQKVFLDAIQTILTENITNYAIDEVEDVWDEDDCEVLRGFFFNRGMKTHIIVISPNGIIKWMTPKFPKTLIINICNELLWHLI